MRIAIAHSAGRISPVFDVTNNLLVIEVVGGAEVRRNHCTLVSRNPFMRAREVAGLGVELLVCGALSHVQEAALVRTGIQVAGFICGDVEAVFDAVITGRLADGCFLMPGCFGNRRRLRVQGRRGGRRWGR
jgi:predicted Fe-Mo cluster-binding NifX family protein